MGQRPSQNRIWCISALKGDIWWQQFVCFSCESADQILRSLHTVKANREPNVCRQSFMQDLDSLREKINSHILGGAKTPQSLPLR